MGRGEVVPRDQQSLEGQVDAESPTKPLRLVVVSRHVGRRPLDGCAQPRGSWLVCGGQPASPACCPEVCRQAREIDLTRLAVVLDVRTRGVLRAVRRRCSPRLAAIGTLPEILFLEAADDVIVRRQESVRRPHPLQGDGRLLDGIHRERETLATLRAAADLVIDTSSLNIHQLGSRVAHAYGGSTDDQLRVTPAVVWLQVRHPRGCGHDLRRALSAQSALDSELRPQTGLSKPVSDYVARPDRAPRRSSPRCRT